MRSFTVSHISYRQRVLLAARRHIVLVLCLLTVFVVSVITRKQITFAAVLLGVYVLIIPSILSSYKYMITRITFRDDSFTVIYYKFNTEHTLKLPISEGYIRWNKPASGGRPRITIPPTMVIEQGIGTGRYKVLVTQEMIGDWTKEKIDEVIKAFKAIYKD